MQQKAMRRKRSAKLSPDPSREKAAGKQKHMISSAKETIRGQKALEKDSSVFLKQFSAAKANEAMRNIQMSESSFKSVHAKCGSILLYSPLIQRNPHKVTNYIQTTATRMTVV